MMAAKMKLAALFALAAAGLQAQTANARLEALVAPYREANAPGMVAMLIREGRVAWQTAFGLADLDTHRPITPDTQFELASMTKQFTAMAIMILSDQGRLKFDDTLDPVLPGVPAVRAHDPYSRSAASYFRAAGLRGSDGREDRRQFLPLLERAARRA